jgi:hypothetical protein
MYMNLRVHQGLLLADSSFLETLRSQSMLENTSDRKTGWPSQRDQTKMSFIDYIHSLTFRPIVRMPFTDALDALKQLPL